MTDTKRRKRAAGRAPRRGLQTPEQAAEIFLRNLTTQVWGDFLDLVEDEGHDPAARARDYANLKRAVRRQHQLPTHDLDCLRDNVLASVSEDHLQSTREALVAYVNAAAEELIVQENAAYILGRAVGRFFGGTARPRKPF